MAPNLQQGDRVIIELSSSEVFEGTIEYMSSRCVELYDIVCPKTNTNFPGNMTFYKNEVIHISQVSKEAEPQDLANGIETNGFPPMKKIKMDPDEFHRLKQMTFDFNFVDGFGKNFEDALQVLSNRESVAVAGLGNTHARGNGLGLLAMADFKQVYIFDMMCLVHLKGLKDIFESSFITKVVHDGAALHDCLKNKYKVAMENVFDTKIIDSMVSREENNENVSRNVSEILSHYFNFPPSLLSAAVDDADDRIWVERPIIKSDKIKAAQLVTYLLPLRDRLMTQIMKPYMTAIQCEYDLFKNDRSLNLLKFK